MSYSEEDAGKTGTGIDRNEAQFDPDTYLQKIHSWHGFEHT